MMKYATTRFPDQQSYRLSSSEPTLSTATTWEELSLGMLLLLVGELYQCRRRLGHAKLEAILMNCSGLFAASPFGLPL